MEIVPVELIPEKENIIDAPTDDLVGVFKICQQLEHICSLENGIGLSAVQVGLPWRLFTIKDKDGHYDFYLNCDYEPAPDARKVQTHEGCLSLKGDGGSLRFFRVERWSKIILSGERLLTEDKLGLDHMANVGIEDELYAVVFQHEIDHQLGPEGLISHKGNEIHIWDQGRRRNVIK